MKNTHISQYKSFRSPRLNLRPLNEIEITHIAEDLIEYMKEENKDLAVYKIKIKTDRSKSIFYTPKHNKYYLNKQKRKISFITDSQKRKIRESKKAKDYYKNTILNN